MYVYDNNCINNNRLSVVIGQNPSKSTNNGIDKTNQNILQAIQQRGEHNFLMLNTFPIINPNGSESINNLKVRKNIKISKLILKKLLRQRIELKIIFAYGKSLDVYTPFLKMIRKFSLSKRVKTYVFMCGNTLVTHFAQRSLNTLNVNMGALYLSECDVKTKGTKRFDKVKFLIK